MGGYTKSEGCPPHGCGANHLTKKQIGYTARPFLKAKKTNTQMLPLKNQYRKFPTLFTVAWAILAVAIFLIDLSVPLGVADGMLYVVLVLGGLLVGERRLIIGWGIC